MISWELKGKKVFCMSEYLKYHVQSSKMVEFSLISFEMQLKHVCDAFMRITSIFWCLWCAFAVVVRWRRIFIIFHALHTASIHSLLLSHSLSFDISNCVQFSHEMWILIYAFCTMMIIRFHFPFLVFLSPLRCFALSCISCQINFIYFAYTHTNSRLSRHFDFSSKNIDISTGFWSFGFSFVIHAYICHQQFDIGLPLENIRGKKHSEKQHPMKMGMNFPFGGQRMMWKSTHTHAHAYTATKMICACLNVRKSDTDEQSKHCSFGIAVTWSVRLSFNFHFSENEQTKPHKFSERSKRKENICNIQFNLNVQIENFDACMSNMHPFFCVDIIIGQCQHHQANRRKLFQIDDIDHFEASFALWWSMKTSFSLIAFSSIRSNHIHFFGCNVSIFRLDCEQHT